jgi:hypothetical protein
MLDTLDIAVFSIRIQVHDAPFLIQNWLDDTQCKVDAILGSQNGRGVPSGGVWSWRMLEDKSMDTVHKMKHT